MHSTKGTSHSSEALNEPCPKFIQEILQTVGPTQKQCKILNQMLNHHSKTTDELIPSVSKNFPIVTLVVIVNFLSFWHIWKAESIFVF